MKHTASRGAACCAAGVGWNADGARHRGEGLGAGAGADIAHAVVQRPARAATTCAGTRRRRAMCMRRRRTFRSRTTAWWCMCTPRRSWGRRCTVRALGLTLTTDADVSLVPEAEGESVGFRDARIERLSESKELNFLLEPFLSHKLPSQMKVNAADLMRKAAEPVGGSDRLHVDAGLAEAALDAGRPRCAGGGCGCRYERRLSDRAVSALSMRRPRKVDSVSDPALA